MDAQFPPRHYLSEVWGNPDEERFLELRDSMEDSGQREPIVLYEGQVLDGWQRLRACRALGIEPRYEVFAGNDPIEFVRDKHTRRSCSKEQRAIAIAKMYQWQPVGRPENPAPGAELISKLSGNPAPGAEFPARTATTATMAADAGISTRSMERVKKVVADGSQELVKAVEQGKVPIKRAAEIAKLPQDQQSAAISAPPPRPPKPAPSPVPGVEDELREQVSGLGAELQDARDQIAALSKIVEADEQLATAVAEVQRYRAMVKGLQQRVQSMLEEIAELKRSAQFWKGKAEAANVA
jgi:hypothetical protein